MTQDKDVWSGVVFDLHGTLVWRTSPNAWLSAAGATPEETERWLPVIDSIWERAAVEYPGSDWDLDPALHRRIFTELLVRDSDCPMDTAIAIYEELPRQGGAVDGALDLLAGLRAAGKRLILLSNIGFDPRPMLERSGLAAALDDVVLSYEVGMVKPAPRIFELAASRIGLAPEDCVMVGDTPATDGGSVKAGMPCVLVPRHDGAPDLRPVRAMLLG